MIDLILDTYVRSFAVLLPAAVTAFVSLHAHEAGLPHGRVVGAALAVAVALGLWSAGAAQLAANGLLDPPATALEPPYILMILTGGALFLWALARATATGRRITDTMGQEVLIGFQSFRVMGGIFLLGWAAGVIPWQFALPAGLGDIWAGVAGYRAMRAVTRVEADARAKVIRANVIGLADFAVAVLMGVTTSDGMFQLFSHNAPNIINAWPLGLFPAFFVPIFIAFHLLSLGKLRETDKAIAA
ncbi:hypothetical protein OEZ60_06885 [Defluviimonas sp. WL0024]|uniref:MFS transporter n=2 Tax=Albidovulum TaxID=205889 RepID=A0ABT3J2C3_9RHOB|nr:MULTISPECIES: hypothetical protein [Defluviimonas]MCU9847729.1 hypothetical protein [Defluviimonas sp. WL0024]MCW3781842.1 hypothetical protein [Defluviimonas salinarum]